MVSAQAVARPLLPDWFLAALLALATLALYWPATHHDFVNYDDDRYVTANVQVQNGLTFENLKWAFKNPVADNWHPMTVLSHMLVCQFFGVNPWAHHLVNVLLHAANAALVFVLLQRLTGARWRSLMVAALFAVHPLRVESVAWVAERKDVLCGWFGLLALIFYARYAQAAAAKRVRNFLLSPAYWLAWCCFALGLMSKPMLVTWPFVLLLLDYWPLERVASYKSNSTGTRPFNFQLSILNRLLLEKIPFFILSAAASVATYLVQQHGGALDMMQNLSLGARCANALIACCRYLEKIFWPANLSVLYPHPGVWPLLDVLLAGGFLLGLSAVLVMQWRRHPGLLMGWLWFVGTLVPVCGLIQVGLQSIADRYTYLPTLGILIFAVWGATELTSSWRHQTALLAAAGSAAVLLCAVLTRQQLAYWQDGETLFRHAIAVTENNYIAQYNLGVALDQKNQTDEAIRQYEAVLRVKPDYAGAHVNLGSDLDSRGQTDAAIREYQEAIRLAPDNTSARTDLGIAYFNTGQNEAAISQYQEVLRLSPDNPYARNNLGGPLYKLGRTDDAVHQFQEALRLKPDYVAAHLNLANVLAKMGSTNEAVRQYQEVLRLNPDHAEARERLAKILEPPGK
jgi:tetratricopeptide (TPR) repeat protein